MKPFFVVCIDDNWLYNSVGRLPLNRPIKGEIYKVINVKNIDGLVISGVLAKGNAFELAELPQWWGDGSFRPIDESFGEWVEETILKEVVLEETLNQKI